MQRFGRAMYVLDLTVTAISQLAGRTISPTSLQFGLLLNQADRF